jgi:hypothetical protein
MEKLWQWHDAFSAKEEDVPQCSDNSAMLFSKLDSHAFLAKLSNAMKKTCPADGRFSARYVRASLRLLF